MCLDVSNVFTKAFFRCARLRIIHELQRPDEQPRHTSTLLSSSLVIRDLGVHAVGLVSLILRARERGGEMHCWEGEDEKDGG